MSDFEDAEDQQKERDNGLYCRECGRLIEPMAVRNSSGVWELWMKCPNGKIVGGVNKHSNEKTTDQPHIISQAYVNPDSVNDVTDDKFTAEEIDSLINTSLYQRFNLWCAKCKEHTIQIRYQRQTSTMKFFSICVNCKTAVDLSTVKQPEK